MARWIHVHRGMFGVADAGRSKRRVWEKWSNGGRNQKVAKLMEEDMKAAMLFLWNKSPCVEPISHTSLVYHSHRRPEPPSLKPEQGAPS